MAASAAGASAFFTGVLLVLFFGSSAAAAAVSAPSGAAVFFVLGIAGTLKSLRSSLSFPCLKQSWGSAPETAHFENNYYYYSGCPRDCNAFLAGAGGPRGGSTSMPHSRCPKPREHSKSMPESGRSIILGIGSRHKGAFWFTFALFYAQNHGSHEIDANIDKNAFLGMTRPAPAIKRAPCGGLLSALVRMQRSSGCAGTAARRGCCACR